MTAYIMRTKTGNILMFPQKYIGSVHGKGPTVKIDWPGSDTVRYQVFMPGDDEYRELDEALKRFEVGS